MKRNYRNSLGEIDIIAFDPSENAIVFVEVRTRKEGATVHPLETVDSKKRRKLKRTALAFLKELGSRIRFDSFRFDVIGIEGESVIHVKSAF